MSSFCCLLKFLVEFKYYIIYNYFYKTNKKSNKAGEFNMSTILTPLRAALDKAVAYKNEGFKYAKEHQHYAAAGAIAIFVFPNIVQGMIVGAGAKLIHAGWKRLDLDTHIEPRVKPSMDALANRLNISSEAALEDKFGKGMVSEYGAQFFSYINPVSYEGGKSAAIAIVSAIGLAYITGGGALYIAGALFAYGRLSALISGISFTAQMLQPFVPEVADHQGA